MDKAERMPAGIAHIRLLQLKGNELHQSQQVDIERKENNL